MGTYINPGNEAFAEISGTDYVDKTGLIAIINRRIGTGSKLLCISRPRRFGKSYAAKMLAAYYDCSCDSHELFDGRKIGESETYRRHMNRYHVISLDITGFISEVKIRSGRLNEVPMMIEEAIRRDLASLDVLAGENDSLNDCLLRFVERTGRRIVFIIDEWDAMIRETLHDSEAKKRYLNLLRNWFKNSSFTPKVVAAAYMTGILPIKKDGSQSAISDFHEFTILEPWEFTEYTGFTEQEVRALCAGNGPDFEEVKAWYDGYDFPEVGSLYNPYSVMSARRTGKCRSYWRKTSAAESLQNYISMDFAGLQATVARLIAGEEVEVDVEGFQNDFETFESADDVLTLMIHLGYLSYREEAGTARIPNEEVRMEFEQFLTRRSAGTKWMELIQRSQKLLDDTVLGNAPEVAAAIDAIRAEQYAPQYYNNEQALRAVIKYAYIVAFGQYVKIEELPSGKGLADVVFLPQTASRLPAMVIELKWNRTADGAIAQIREKNYTAALKPFAGNILLVGLNYDEKTGRHSCRIERA